MTDMLPVTQADRDAVQAFHRTMADRLMADIKSPDRPKMGEDEGDAGTLVQAFARHRIASASAPAGWRMVPVEPTEKMVSKGGDAMLALDTQDAGEAARVAWSAMLTAAPQPPVVGEPIGAMLICDKTGGRMFVEWPVPQRHHQDAEAIYGDEGGYRTVPLYAASATQPAEERMREALVKIRDLGDDGEHSGDRHAQCRAIARAALKEPRDDR